MHLSQFWLSKKLPFSLIYVLLSLHIHLQFSTYSSLLTGKEGYKEHRIWEFRIWIPKNRVQQAVELFSLFLSSMFIILSLQFFFACSKLSLFTVVRKIPVKSTLSSVRKITMFFLDPGGNCHTLKMSKIPNKCVLQTQKHIALWLSQ